MECAASLDVLRLRKLVAPPQYDHGIRLLEAVVAMLTKMFCASTSGRSPPRSSSRQGPRPSQRQGQRGRETSAGAMNRGESTRGTVGPSLAELPPGGTSTSRPKFMRGSPDPSRRASSLLGYGARA